MDRLELRRKNFIAKDEFPYETALGIVYDSGDYHGALDRLLANFDLDAFRARPGAPSAARASTAASASRPTSRCAGWRPSRAVGSAGRGPPGRVLRVGQRARDAHRLGDRLLGRLAARAGARHELRPDRGRPAGHRPGERDRPARGHRPGRLGLGHVRLALAVRGRRGRGAGGAQGAGQGQAHLRGAAGGGAGGHRADRRQVPGARLARQVDDDGGDLGRGPHPAPRAARPTSSPGSRRAPFYDPENFVFPFGAHACVVEVDAETGKVAVVDYYAVDDCGPAINPMLIDGQVHGGIVHAIGQALYEQVVYDDEGQLVTGTFVDYALPTAAELPHLHTDRTETPSPTNSLGVKGVGEAGTIAATPAVAAAVLDALAPLGVKDLDMPLTPMRVYEAIQAAAATARDRPPASRDATRKEARGDHGGVRLRGARDPRRGRAHAGRERGRGEADRRRALAAAADEAAPGRARAAGGPAARARPARHPARERQLADRRDGASRRPPGHARARRGVARGRPDRRPAGAKPRHDRRLAGARRPRLRHARRAAGAGGRAVGAGPGRPAHDRRRGVLPGLPDHVAQPRRGDHRGARPGRRRLGLRL